MKNKNKKDLFLKAKNYCFYLLKFRARSESEIYRRLKEKGFSEEIIKEIIAYLKEKKFLNDLEFCKEWINSKINKKFGLERIKHELKQKGIETKIIEKEIERIKEEYPEDKIISEIIKDRLKRIKNLNPKKLKTKLFGYLVRRGFKIENVQDLLNQYIKDE
ncbi:MAG: RecX family transcriptional regulator [Candidatus Omnitrophica bacterium]|nr:RecX family transcriptional regulator [Candidatus Omnitrophota bacterium]